MGWAIGWDNFWKRDIGYGVPAYCDHPDCSEEIDRGLGYVCGNEPYGGDQGCGLYFCGKHQIGPKQRCERCAKRRRAFSKKPDHPTWIRHKLTDASWQRWRCKNPDEAAAMARLIDARPTDSEKGKAIGSATDPDPSLSPSAHGSEGPR